MRPGYIRLIGPASSELRRAFGVGQYTDDMSDMPLKLFCREMNSGNGYTGRLSISNHQIEATLLSFEKPSSITTQQPVHLSLDDARIATLLDCLPFAWGYARSPDRQVWKGNVIANSALIGPSPWELARKVRSATFHFHESRVALLAPRAIESRFEHSEDATGNESYKFTAIVDGSTKTLARAQARDLDVHIWSSFSHSLGSQKQVIDLVPTVTVDFKRDVSLSHYLSVICEIVALFSLSIGYPATPFDIKISSLSNLEARKALSDGNFPEVFEARYTWGDQPPPPAYGLWAGGAVLQITHSTERASTEDCLVAWLNRREEWRAASGLMMNSLRRQERMDKERLIGAVTWFENIPMNEYSAAVTSAQLSSITEVAMAEAKRLGLASSEDRLRTAIARLTDESLSQRFRRLIHTIRHRFGSDLVPDRLEADCKIAVDLRGKATHASLGDDENLFINLSKAVYAVEYVAFLPMICDLPISESAPPRLRHHPFLEYLRFEDPRTART